jgi:hypothetical protein
VRESILVFLGLSSKSKTISVFSLFHNCPLFSLFSPWFAVAQGPHQSQADTSTMLLDFLASWAKINLYFFIDHLVSGALW